MRNKELAKKAFEELLHIMDDLRKGCPWDREQTFESLRHLTIEEVYELSEEIKDQNYQNIKGELGDLLLHIVFYSKLGEEKKEFDIADVIQAINKKLIFRHPHIYGDTQVVDAKEVKENWEKLKMKEGKKSVLEGVPRSLPPLIKAYRIQDKARGAGFDWEKTEQVWDKVQEEMNELKAEVQSQESQEKIEGEFGDLLFALINYARFIGVNPEDALERTNKKFINRFQYMEEKVKESGLDLMEMDLMSMEEFWKEAKKKGL
jgi:XTP/dITP diphosphohydrolase